MTEQGFAIPVRYYLEFMEANRLESALRPGVDVTYDEYLAELFAADEFRSSSTFRFEKLAALTEHTREESRVDALLVEKLKARIREVSRCRRVFEIRKWTGREKSRAFAAAAPSSSSAPASTCRSPRRFSSTGARQRGGGARRARTFFFRDLRCRLLKVRFPG